MTTSPPRSVLYMPGSNVRALEKARAIEADALIFDLEDAVAPEAKGRARENVVAALKTRGYGNRQTVVRINGLDTEWGTSDLKAAVGCNPHAILVPKVSNPDDLMPIQAALSAAQASSRIWAMMETPLAMLQAGAIAGAALATAPAFGALVMGTNDLGKETGTALKPGRLAYLPWLMTCIAAARAFGLSIFDGVFNDLDDAEGFESECRNGRDLGMDGKTLIHPRQVAPCNRLFSPSDEDVAWAEAICVAFARPENAAAGVIRIDGQMVERLHLAMARRVLERAGKA